MAFLLAAAFLFAQQIPDTSAFFQIKTPQYPRGEGPVVTIDAAHHNFHTLEGRYAAFGNILKADGYQLRANTEVIAEEILKKCRIYVISNPLHQSNQGNWSLPTPSAFTPNEIKAIQEWVSGGGRLFLIADHMPFAGAAADLAKAFGVEYLNSFALDDSPNQLDYFSRENARLIDHSIINGQQPNEKVDSIVTFTGSAFRLPQSGRPLIVLDDRFTIWLPQTAWQFDKDAKEMDGAGYCQLGVLSYGRGKIVFSGEAAMFSAQLAGPNHFPMGLNNPAARQNIPLLLNIVHWLDE